MGSFQIERLLTLTQLCLPSSGGVSIPLLTILTSDFLTNALDLFAGTAIG